ncbi:uncharacterized protein LOC112028166 [Quercus suber]|uniref:uncharacterized protein LOC112028166 n=1 Tax=Quercus suber TaxID=58331 RepID=UPI000CE19934|nr:uncharacterized protein LOC112028166 [Quercus suber]
MGNTARKNREDESFQSKQTHNDKPEGSTKDLKLSTDGSISSDQLKELIKEAIKDQVEGGSQSSIAYAKPYTQRIDLLRMPQNYRPPKFQQFEGKGNPRQHVAYFVEACNNAGTYGDLMVKQFVRSLKGNAFDWYTDLAPSFIDSWNQMEREFLNRFYSTRRTISMIELTNSKQWKEELVIDYIQRWRNLSLNYKDQLSEASTIEMCIQGMNWASSCILQGIEPKTFEELATRAHDMELSIAFNGHQGPPVQEPHNRRERQDTRKGGKFPHKLENKQSLIVTTAPLKVPVKPKIKEQTYALTQERRRRPTLQEMQEKQYPFPNSNTSNMLEHLLELKLIELLEMKRPKEANQANDPKYCKYHRLIGHPIEQCFVLKDKIMELAHQGKIMFDDEVATANLAMVASTTTSTYFTIQFGLFEPIEVKVPLSPVPIFENYIFSSFTCYQVSGEEEYSDSEEETERAIVYRAYWSSIIFTDDDHLLGFKIHNHPLFVTGYIREHQVNRILIDEGSAVNILPLKILKELGISLDELLPSRLMIQGFNQGGQRAIGKIILHMLIGEMESSALFHVIDAKTTYKVLIGRPWLHEYDIVPSMYHQCFKYFQDGQVKKIVADHKPFTIVESHFADAKFYLEDDTLEEAQVIVSPSSKEVNLHSKTLRIDFLIEKKEAKPTEEKDNKQIKTSKKEKKHESSTATKAAPVLHYVPVTK